MKNISKVTVALATAATLAVGVVAPAANAATRHADSSVKKNLVAVNAATVKQKSGNKYKNVYIKSGTIFEGSTQKSKFRGYVKVKKVNGGTYDVPRSKLTGVTKGAVQLTSSDSSTRLKKGAKLYAFTVKKSGKVLTERGWVSKSKLRAIPLNTYSVKRTTKAVHGTGYVYGKLYKGERVTGFEGGAFSIKGQGKRWWVESGNSLVNSGDLQYKSSYKMRL